MGQVESFDPFQILQVQLWLTACTGSAMCCKHAAEVVLPLRSRDVAAGAAGCERGRDQEGLPQVVAAGAVFSVIPSAQAGLALAHSGFSRSFLLPPQPMASIALPLAFLPLQYHPDKNPDPKAHHYFATYVAKAYKALTDEVSRENYKKYGHPDGPQAMTGGFWRWQGWLI